MSLCWPTKYAWAKDRPQSFSAKPLRSSENSNAGLSDSLSSCSVKACLILRIDRLIAVSNISSCSHLIGSKAPANCILGGGLVLAIVCGVALEARSDVRCICFSIILDLLRIPVDQLKPLLRKCEAGQQLRARQLLRGRNPVATPRPSQVEVGSTDCILPRSA